MVWDEDITTGLEIKQDSGIKLDLKRCELLVKLALEEDIQQGDITTISCIPREAQGKAIVRAKEVGIVCGLDIISCIFRIMRAGVDVETFTQDGAAIKKGDVIAIIRGPTRALLTAERTILNFLQQLSGVATLTQQYVQQVEGYSTKILDTRKTVPGMRYLQKYAVRCGGGQNHRQGLYDMVMIKDNHIKAAGSIKNAFQLVQHLRLRNREKKMTGEKNLKEDNLKVEIECSTLEEVQEALTTDCDWIMLDNMPLSMMKAAMSLIRGQRIVEASGDMTLERVKSVARLGVDYISVGALTHSAKALDMNMKNSAPGRRL